MNIQYGYCTNVHAGATLEETRANLERHAVAVKERFCPNGPLGIGLWLSASSARKLIVEKAIDEFAGWLGDKGLVPFTLNGFPFGDFHRPVVKHDVYLPTWLEAERLDFTRDLIAILDRLLPAGQEGSISTLPLLWGRPRPSGSQLELAATNLAQLAGELARLEKDSGRLIHICLEPEPGCALSRSDDVVRFFEHFLLPGRNEAVIRRYLRICHDICHAAVMFEEQEEVLERYRSAGLSVGKIQVSSAVALDSNKLKKADHRAAIAQLARFHEPRYLHQTSVIPGPSRSPIFFEDLPLALGSVSDDVPSDWRVHFHVPIYLRGFGHLSATQDDMLSCLRLAKEQQTTQHFEVETYAWGVLPSELQQPELADGIAEEMRWFEQAWSATAP